MDSERMLFEKGCFLPSWAEDTTEKEPLSQAYAAQSKDLETLKQELADIKKHIEDVRERQWNIARALEFHNHNFARE